MPKVCGDTIAVLVPVENGWGGWCQGKAVLSA